jgi:hypothetical protein
MNIKVAINDHFSEALDRKKTIDKITNGPFRYSNASLHETSEAMHDIIML